MKSISQPGDGRQKLRDEFISEIGRAKIDSFARNYVEAQVNALVADGSALRAKRTMHPYGNFFLGFAAEATKDFH